ncbi:MAG TPA: hypothetical protein VGK48_06350 [Terriglobia bacterium]|jgi:hypothetical protein
MRSRALAFVGFMSLFVLVTAVLAQDPLTGSWAGDWGPSRSDRNPVTLSLKWDGKALTGNVTGGEGVPEPIPIQKGTYDAKTGKLHMEAQTVNRRTNQSVRFIIDGKLEKGEITGSWNHDDRQGDFTLKKR